MIILDPADSLAAGVLVSSNVAETDYPAHSTTALYIEDERVMDATTHKIYESLMGATSAVTMTLASPGVVNWTAHGQAANTPIKFTTTGALPAGLVAGTTYYVKTLAADTLKVSATPGGADINFTGSQSGVHTAVASNNVNRALTDTTYWNFVSYTNRYKMLDQLNNTQTENAESIAVTLQTGSIAQGAYGGNIDGNSVVITVTDSVEGVVYTETQNLVISDSNSSFYRWFFNEIRRKTYFFTGTLPPYNNATISITVEKAGGTAKCGVLCVGRLKDIGLSQYGLSTEIKDYSSTTFNFDGTSATVVRGYAKRMSVDILIDNDLIDSVQEQLADFRQRNVLWVGAVMYGSAIVFGKYSSFKNVISNFSNSKMALQLEGTV